MNLRYDSLRLSQSELDEGSVISEDEGLAGEGQVSREEMPGIKNSPLTP